MTDVPVLEDGGHIVVALNACCTDPTKILRILEWEFMLLAPGFELSHALFCALFDILKIIQMLFAACEVHVTVL